MQHITAKCDRTVPFLCTTTVTTMTFVILRELHAIIGSALDDIERVYKEASSPGEGLSTPGRCSAPDSVSSSTTTATKEKCSSFAFDHGYASPPPSPSVATATGHPFPHHRPCTPSSPTLDFPALDLPCDPASPSEVLTSHPTVMQAINKIIAAAGQMTATVQTPFLSLCDASMVVSTSPPSVLSRPFLSVSRRLLRPGSCQSPSAPIVPVPIAADINVPRLSTSTEV